jgi:hypothetical protein
MVAFVYTVGRPEGLNEFKYLFIQLSAKDPWALFVFLGYLYLVIWWYFFINSFTSNQLPYRLNKLLEKIMDWFKQILAKIKKDRSGQSD